MGEFILVVWFAWPVGAPAPQAVDMVSVGMFTSKDSCEGAAETLKDVVVDHRCLAR